MAIILKSYVRISGRVFKIKLSFGNVNQQSLTYAINAESIS